MGRLVLLELARLRQGSRWPWKAAPFPASTPDFRILPFHVAAFTQQIPQAAASKAPINTKRVLLACPVPSGIRMRFSIPFVKA
jgi:hypothetical protein